MTMSRVALPFVSGDSRVGYSFYAVLNTLPQIAAASLVPPIAIVAVALLLKRTRPKPLIPTAESPRGRLPFPEAV